MGVFLRANKIEKKIETSAGKFKSNLEIQAKHTQGRRLSSFLVTPLFPGNKNTPKKGGKQTPQFGFSLLTSNINFGDSDEDSESEESSDLSEDHEDHKEEESEKERGKEKEKEPKFKMAVGGIEVALGDMSKTRGFLSPIRSVSPNVNASPSTLSRPDSLSPPGPGQGHTVVKSKTGTVLCSSLTLTATALPLTPSHSCLSLSRLSLSLLAPLSLPSHSSSHSPLSHSAQPIRHH